MANTPAKAGSSREQATAVPGALATPDAPTASRTAPAPATRAAAGHRAARPADASPGLLAWLPYLIVLAGVAAGVALAFSAPQDAGRGAGLVGCSLLAAGLVRLVLPPRYATILSSRGKTSDVLAFAAFGAAVLAVALSLP
jgi:hypothetical protein